MAKKRKIGLAERLYAEFGNRDYSSIDYRPEDDLEVDEWTSYYPQKIEHLIVVINPSTEKILCSILETTLFLNNSPEKKTPALIREEYDPNGKLTHKRYKLGIEGKFRTYIVRK